MADNLKFPAPYFGGKSTVASDVWDALGDVNHYIEPFCGSAAVLLGRPNWHENKVESINDADGHISNIWRALQSAPDEVAKVCDWPVNHADLIARKARLNRETPSLLERLCADDKYFDVELAGYWIWAASQWIGHGLICPTQRPHIGDGGQGVHASGQIPHISDRGKGVHASGQRPHIGDGGQGVHASGKRPHISNSGMGVHASGQIPHISNSGKGVHASGKIPHISNSGKESPDVRDPYNTNLWTWFRKLSERLRYVRVVCGDWKRVCGGEWQTKIGVCGIFFDPPYSDVANRDSGLYAVDSESVAHDVREWCLERGDDPDMRIVLAGYYEEHNLLEEHGWTVQKWSAGGGYANTSAAETNGKVNRHKEALFFSPHCLREELLFAPMGRLTKIVG